MTTTSNVRELKGERVEEKYSHQVTQDPNCVFSVREGGTYSRSTNPKEKRYYIVLVHHKEKNSPRVCPPNHIIFVVQKAQYVKKTRAECILPCISSVVFEYILIGSNVRTCTMYM